MVTIPRGMLQAARALRQDGARAREVGRAILSKAKAETRIEALERDARRFGTAAHRFQWGEGCEDLLSVDAVGFAFRYWYRSSPQSVWEELTRETAIQMVIGS